MAARIEEDDEVGRMITARRALGTEGLRVRPSLVQIVNMQVEMKLLRYRVVRPGRWLVIERQLEVQLATRAADDRDPLVLRRLDLPAEQGRIEPCQPLRIIRVEHHGLEADSGVSG